MAWVLVCHSLLAAVLTFVCGRHRGDEVAKLFARSQGVIAFGLWLLLWWWFDDSVQGYQFESHLNWIPSLGMVLKLGIDGFALNLIGLTIVVSLSLLFTDDAMGKMAYHPSAALVWLVQGIAFGLFMATDGVLFYFFWEMALMPLFLAISLEGGSGRRSAGLKFFMFTFASSVLLLLGILYLGFKAEDFAFERWWSLPLDITEQQLLFVGFMLAFIVKLPLVPLHTWLPDAHPEAPTYASALLSALMLKFGTYGILRLALPLFPDAAAQFSGPLMVFALIGLYYSGFLAWRQTEVKKLIAYSSIAHMSVVLVGLFLIHWLPESNALESGQIAFNGAVVQMLAHGLSSAGLFLMFGQLARIYGKKRVDAYAGLAKSHPLWSGLFFVLMLNNIGLPGTSGFLGEFMILMSAFQASPLLSMVLVGSVVITAMYSFGLIKVMLFGEVRQATVSGEKKLTVTQLSGAGFLVMTALLVGLFPWLVIQPMQSGLTDGLRLSLTSRL